MNYFSPAEFTSNYMEAGEKKAKLNAQSTLVLGILAGVIIAVGGAASAIVSCSVQSASVARLLSGLIFPLGLGIVILSGAELFTGNSLMLLSLWGRRITLFKLLRNWGIVYLANLLGSLITSAAICFTAPQFGDGAFALSSIKVAAAKCSLPFPEAVVLGIFCNFLVALAVLLSLSAKDNPGRILGAYLPVCFFVLCGFEHSVANMYCIPTGLMLSAMPQYQSAAIAAGIDISVLTPTGFVFGNLLPVTIGNILGCFYRRHYVDCLWQKASGLTT